MQSDNRIFEDFAKVMNGAVGTFAGVAREGEAAMRARLRDWIGGDFVTRDEFEAIKAMAIAAREEVEVLKARLDAMATGKASKAD